VIAAVLAVVAVFPGAGLAGPATADLDTVLFYDSGVHTTWWCSDRDSFGAAVKFTPAEYPCEVTGARAEVGYDDGQQIYLRVFDDNGPGGLPGTVLYEEQRLDIPHGQNIGFRDYNLTAPVTVDSGDFYVCFWQKNVWDMLFSTDEQFNYPARQWWFFPDLGWVTPMGMDAADQLIRAKVRYGTGVEEELGVGPAGLLRIRPNPTSNGLMRFDLAGPRSFRIMVADACGRTVFEDRACVSGQLDLRFLAPGVYMVSAVGSSGRQSAKLVVER
jgi:hypothetical protein